MPGQVFLLNGRVLVIGGGVSGLAASIALAKLWHPVELVERSQSLGGRTAELAATFPDLRPGREVVDGLLDVLSKTSGVSTHLGAELLSLIDENGSFRAELSDGATVEVVAIILATGLDIVPPSLIPEYGHGLKNGVVTSLGLQDRLANGELIGRKGLPARRVVMVQCVGSRTERRGVPYCSAVCCANAVKDSLAVKKLDPSAEVTVLYIDLRTCGKGQEALYREARKQGVRFIRGQPALVMEKDGSLVVAGENTLLRELYELPADLVVLSCGLRQSPENLLLFDELGVKQSAIGFPRTADGCSTDREGVFLAGSVTGPMDIPTAMAHGRSCALLVHERLQSK